MNRIIEIVRKLALVVICGPAGLFGIFCVGYGLINADERQVSAIGLLVLLTAFAFYKLINWIFSSKEGSE